MSTYEQDEASAENSAPREGFEITHGPTVYRIASGTRSMLIDGNLYTALPSGRDEFSISFLGSDSELAIRLPLTHPFVTRWFQGGIPPKIVAVSAIRRQKLSGSVRRFWYGKITGCKVEGEVAVFRAPAISADAFDRYVPSFTVGRLCPWILYEAGCEKSRAGFGVNATVVAVAGARVTISALGQPDQWAQFGELVHVPSGERMTIFSQAGTVIQIQLPIFELKAGDAVTIYAGCLHTVDDCLDKFDNVDNYGGAEELPQGNIFFPNGFGIFQSEPDA